MAIRMKGLIRGLRYISNIFDAKEQEMEIGYPTDVKHVAHIGWDGPSIGGPTWMNQFCSAPLEDTGGGDRAEVPHFPSSEYILTGELPGLLSPKPLKKPSRRKKQQSEKSTDRTAVESPKEASRYNQSSRRHSTGEREPSESTRRGRREARHETGDISGAGENHSGEQELPAGIPKQSRRRKVKGSSSTSGGGSGSARSSRSKARANADQAGSQNGGDLVPTKTIEGASSS